MINQATAIISENAVIGNNVHIGEFSVIEDGVIISDDVYIDNHVVIKSGTFLGKGTKVHSFAVLGSAPQDLSYNDEETFLIVGENCVIREHVVINSGSIKEDLKTIVGNNCYLMSGVHVGHDCKLGDNIVIGPNSAFGGHCHVQNNAFIGGNVGVHQFIRIGMGALVGGAVGVRRDIIPFALVNNKGLLGANLIGLKRDGIDNKTLRTFFVPIFKQLMQSDIPLTEVIKGLENSENAYIQEIHKFLKAPSKRSIPVSYTHLTLPTNREV